MYIILFFLIMNTMAADPEFDAEFIVLSFPDTIREPFRKLIDSVSIVLGNVLQNTAERFENFLEYQIKPFFLTQIGYDSTESDDYDYVDSPYSSSGLRSIRRRRPAKRFRQQLGLKPSKRVPVRQQGIRYPIQRNEEHPQNNEVANNFGIYSRLKSSYSALSRKKYL